MNWTAGLASIT